MLLRGYNVRETNRTRAATYAKVRGIAVGARGGGPSHAVFALGTERRIFASASQRAADARRTSIPPANPLGVRRIEGEYLESYHS